MHTTGLSIKSVPKCVYCGVTCRIEVYDYAKVKGKQDDVVLQQNDAYCTQLQLQQNVSYATSSSENVQQKQYVYMYYVTH